MKFRKTVQFLLAMTIACVCFSLPALATEGSASFTVGTVTANAGDTVEVPVTMENNITGGFLSTFIGISFDTEHLELISVTPGSAISAFSTREGYGFSNSKVDYDGITEMFTFQYDETAQTGYGPNITVSGEVAILTFKVAETAPDNKYEITLTGEAMNDHVTWFVDSSWTPINITPTVNAGSITVGSGGTTEPGGDIDPTPTGSYTASLGTPSPEKVAPGETFTVDVMMTSESDLAAGELELSYDPEFATIKSIALAEGLQSSGEQTIDNDAGTAKISFFGNTASAADGLTVATVTFEAASEGTASVSITSATAAASGNTADLDVTVPSSPVTVTVEASDTITVSTYTPSYTLVKYIPAAPLEAGQVAMYSDHPMYTLTKEDGTVTWLYLAESGVTTETAEGNITTGAGTAGGAVALPGAVADLLAGDLNSSNAVNIVDAQIAYDVATEVYSDFTKVDMLHWLMADVNGDGTVTTADARAIQIYIHTLVWGSGNDA